MVVLCVVMQDVLLSPLVDGMLLDGTPCRKCVGGERKTYRQKRKVVPSLRCFGQVVRSVDGTVIVPCVVLSAWQGQTTRVIQSIVNPPVKGSDATHWARSFPQYGANSCGCRGRKHVIGPIMDHACHVGC